jgi:hypothetical protein
MRENMHFWSSYSANVSAVSIYITQNFLLYQLLASTDNEKQAYSTFMWCGQLRKNLVCMWATWNSKHGTDHEQEANMYQYTYDFPVSVSVIHVQ